LKIISLFLCFIVFGQINLAQNLKIINNNVIIVAHKVDEPIKIDGQLNENIWKGKPITGFTQLDPDEGKPATEKTNVWVAYDKDNLYIAAQLFDSHPENIDRSLTRRDVDIQSDWFYIGIDSYHDKRTGFYFGVNAGGSISDGTISNDATNFDGTWDGIWESSTKINKKGWALEIKIPFTQLRFEYSKEMQWGINFTRNIKRKNESDFFVMVPKKESGFVSHFAVLTGLNGISEKKRFELLPYIVQKAQYLVHDAGDPFYKGNQYKTSIGGNIKVGIGSNLTVDAAINPDFGQVEVDPAVVNLTAFETFFKEKRPFFIEGSNIFDFGRGGANNNFNFNFGVPELFYSRRIGRSPQGEITKNYSHADYPSDTRILAAAKLTGKLSNSISIGAVSAITEKTFARLENNGIHSKEEVEPLTHYGVFRLKNEFEDGYSSIGLNFTSVNRKLSYQPLKDILVKDAYTFGIDGWTFLDKDKEYVLTGSLVGSYVGGSKKALQVVQEKPYRYFQRPDSSPMRYDSNRTSLTGSYGRVMLNKQKGNLILNSAIGFVTPGFEYNDLGFQYWADKINGHFLLGYQWLQPGKVFRQVWISAAHFREYDFEGNLIGNGAGVFSNFRFLNYYGFRLFYFYGFESLNKSLTRGGPLTINPKGYRIRLSTYSDDRENTVIRINGSYKNDELGSFGSSIGLNVSWKPMPQLNLSFGPDFSRSINKIQWLDKYKDATAVKTFGNRYVFAQLEQKTVSANIRVNWTFTPKLSLQIFIQPLLAGGHYNDFKELSKPATKNFHIFGKDNNSSIVYDKNNDSYEVSPDKLNNAKSFSISNPDFNFKSLRGNLVLRYEILPGSVLYLAWTHGRVNEDNPGVFNFSRDFKNLWNSPADNVILLKFSYWIDV